MGKGKSAGNDASWSASSALESRERQLRLWRMTMRARYGAILGAVLLALLPMTGEHRYWIAVLAVVVVIPYNATYDVLMRRTGELSPIMAYTDQLLAVMLVIVAPELAAPMLAVFLAIDATSAVSFGRRIAAQSAAIGAIAVGLVLVLKQPADTTAVYLVSLLAGAFIVLVVGAASEVEHEMRHRYVELMGGIDAVVWEQLTRSPSTLAVNRRAEEIFGYSTTAWQEPGFWGRTVYPADRQIAAKAYRDAIRRGESTELEYRMVSAAGQIVHVHDRMRVETDATGRVVKVRGVLLDVTERAEAEASVSQYVNLVERIQMALFVFGLDGDGQDPSLTLLAINPEAAHVTGAHPTASIGSRFTDVVRMPDAEEVRAALADVVRTGEGWVVDDFQIHPTSAGARVYSAHAFPLPGRAVGLSLQDVTERSIAAEVLRHQALHDHLTGLPNRTMLNERMHESIQRAVAGHEPMALLVMDLDQFKDVNDALGHDHGDRLLIEMSRRLVKVLREIDTIARLGGDEFAVLLTNNAHEAGAVAVAERIRRLLEQPFQLGGISVQTNASIGIALFPEHADEAETLTRKADVAMYTAKRSGSGIAVYSPEHDQSSIRRLALLGELRRAIQDDELVLHYQPCLDLTTGDVHHAEALVRWEHPTHGLMPPSEFIELAEVSGVIQPLTRWVLDTALRQIARWSSDGLELTVSVNLSVRNLYDPDLVPWLDDLLREVGVDPTRLKLEITESELMDDPLLAMDVLGRLKALGASTSIDDFGTGYSSLAYLKHLPIDELKIDRSFIANIGHDDNDYTIVRSTIDLSHNLGLGVVAEGVEDDETMTMLARLGCDRAQGYTISYPVPADVLTPWLTDDECRQDLRSRLFVGRGHQ